jgi:hypothetical protein
VHHIVYSKANHHRLVVQDWGKGLHVEQSAYNANWTICEHDF